MKVGGDNDPMVFKCMVIVNFFNCPYGKKSKAGIILYTESRCSRQERFNQRRCFLRPLNLLGTPGMGVILWGVRPPYVNPVPVVRQEHNY
jgi:hypothetical protein